MAASSRTAEKLRFARAVLDDLKHRPGGRGDDFERAREEAFLFHLHGTRDAFLHEINEHYECGLLPRDVKLSRLREWFRGQRRPGCPELQEIDDLEREPKHTLYRLKEWRDASTHRGGVPRIYFVGGVSHGQHHLHDPRASQQGNT